MRITLTLLVLALASLTFAQNTPTYLQEKTATIEAGASLSDAVDLQHKTLVMIMMPVAWTSASLTFQCSTGGSYLDLYSNAGTEKSVTVAASHAIILTPAEFVGCKSIKVRSGTAGSPVTQGSARSIGLVVKPL